MTEDPFIIKANIAHYRTLLQLDISDGKRVQVERLLAAALAELQAVTTSDQTAMGTYHA